MITQVEYISMAYYWWSNETNILVWRVNLYVGYSDMICCKACWTLLYDKLYCNTLVVYNSNYLLHGKYTCFSYCTACTLIGNVMYYMLNTLIWNVLHSVFTSITNAHVAWEVYMVILISLQHFLQDN